MASSNPSPTGSSNRKPLLGRIIVPSIVLAVVLLVVALAKWGRKPRIDPGDKDPRLTYPTPFRNVRPDVKYVGDQVCADCHPGQLETFQHHPMGRSLLPISRIAAEEHYGPETHNPFEKLDYFFQVSRRGDKVYHRRSRKDAKGNVIAEHEDEIQFVLGSGSQGRAYLFSREGYLFQSPISWFSQEKTWDLSPGYSEPLLSGRQVRPGCLDCHSNRTLPVKDTENRYYPPIFDGYAIGCERCHGPGELHVQRRQSEENVEEEDDTIVNPGRLEPALREAVCQQCHLLGTARVQRRHRDLSDYRPGLPLFLFRSVFVAAPNMTDTHQAVGHVDQMYSSRCFQASKGQLGCISCHDPHGVAAPEKKAAFYRHRCLQCHQERRADGHMAPHCALPETKRRELSTEDSCIQCHMTRVPNLVIAHTANTDHRILRKPQIAATHSPEAINSRGPLIVNFYQDLLDPQDRDLERDLGVGLVAYGTEYPNFRQRALELASPLLEKAVQAHPDDLLAWEALATTFWRLDRSLRALKTIEKALELAPAKESVLETAGFLAEKLSHDDAALDYWRRTVEVNPWKPSYRIALARLLSKRQEWMKAAKECRAILELDPANVESRLLLVGCLARSGKPEQARGEFEIAVKLSPKDEDNLRRWFEEQMNEP
jgi:predicted CXXCH cytochrome family protein